MKTNNKSQTAKLVLGSAALIASSMFLGGCVKGDSAGDNGRIEVEKINAPRADIMGLVQDTNGNPIKDAKVAVGGESTKTNSNGTFVLKKIPVTGITGNIPGDDDGDDLIVSIVPPAGYLGAAVHVNPTTLVSVNELNQEGCQIGATTELLQLMATRYLQAWLSCLPLAPR